MDPQSRVSQHGRRAQYGLAAVEGLVALSALSVAALHLPPQSARMTALFGVAIAALALVTICSPARHHSWVIPVSWCLAALTLLAALASRVSVEGEMTMEFFLILIGASMSLYLRASAMWLGLGIIVAGWFLALAVNPVPTPFYLQANLVAAMVILSVLLNAWQQSSKRNEHVLHHLATTDPLTGTLNRRGIEEAAAHMDACVTLAVIDLDDFKLYNDSAGHTAGDALLRDITAAWQTRLRPQDRLGRLGGDEFVVVSPQTTEGELHDLLRHLHSIHPAPWSYGVATRQSDESLWQLVSRADQQLRDAKARRRKPQAA